MEVEQPAIKEAWGHAVDCYGTARIFARRSKTLGFRLNLLTYVGLALPLLVGATAGVFGTGASFLPLLVIATGIVGIFQLCFSLWAVVTGWTSVLAYALESQVDSDRLAEEFRALVQNPPVSGTEMRAKLDRLDTQRRLRDQSDLRQGISAKERHFGLRSGLFEFRRSCGVCGEVPASLSPTKCAACGTFPKGWCA